MSNTVLLKNSGTTGNIPTAGNLTLGEVALNYADGLLYFKNSANAITILANANATAYSNVAVAAYLPTYTGNLSAGNISATGNITGAYIKGNGSLLTNLPAANISGNISANNANTSNYLMAGGAQNGNFYIGLNNATSGYVQALGNSAFIANASTGTLFATNITSSANINGGNIYTAGNLSATGNVSVSNVTVNGFTYVPQTWFKGTLSAAQNLTTSSDTTIIWNSNSDPLNWGNTSNGRITPTKSGWYEVTSRVMFSAVAGNNLNQLNHQILVNGVQQSITQCPGITVSGSPLTLIGTAWVNLNGSSDYITASCWTPTSGQQINGGAASLITVKWIST